MLSAGSTLLKLVPDLSDGLQGRLTDAHSPPGADLFACIQDAVLSERRLFLRIEAHSDLVLRGHAVRAEAGTFLLNLGFGIAVHRAIAAADLTDADFAPTDLVMEFLFLHEANRSVLLELARFNSQLAKARKIALSQAHSDPLTGLMNRRGLDLVLSGLLQPGDRRTAASRAQPFALLHVDLDHFKEVNDTLGHKAGDDLLRHVGNLLRLAIREADTAARIGGDEFVLIIRSLICPDQLTHLAKRIITSIQSVSPPQLSDAPVSASVGVVIWQPGCEYCPDALFALADDALYRSKRGGRGRVTIRHSPASADRR
ncbi:MAG: GGDEF domain-containing protein [Paracoccus sp. (in: a-proteobacteria)]